MYALQDETVRAQPVGLANQVGSMGAQLTQLGGGKRRGEEAGAGCTRCCSGSVLRRPFFHAMGAAIRADRRKLELILGWWLDQGSLLVRWRKQIWEDGTLPCVRRGDGSQFLFQCDVSG